MMAGYGCSAACRAGVRVVRRRGAVIAEQAAAVEELRAGVVALAAEVAELRR